MSEREILVEQDWANDEWQVVVDDRFLASFVDREDAEEYADRKRLEP